MIKFPRSVIPFFVKYTYILYVYTLYKYTQFAHQILKNIILILPIIKNASNNYFKVYILYYAKYS